MTDRRRVRRVLQVRDHVQPEESGRRDQSGERARLDATLLPAIDQVVGHGEQATHRDAEEDQAGADPDSPLDAPAEDVGARRLRREPGRLAQRSLDRVATALVVDRLLDVRLGEDPREDEAEQARDRQPVLRVKGGVGARRLSRSRGRQGFPVVRLEPPDRSCLGPQSPRRSTRPSSSRERGRPG